MKLVILNSSSNYLNRLSGATCECIFQSYKAEEEDEWDDKLKKNRVGGCKFAYKVILLG
jgi:hypothetical protein